MVGPLPGPGTGGVATAVVNLCPRLAQIQDIDVYLFADNKSCATLSEWKRQRNGYHLYTPLRRSLRSIRSYTKLFGVPRLALTFVLNRLRRLRGESWDWPIAWFRYSDHFLYLEHIIAKIQPDVIHAHHADYRPFVCWLSCDGKIPIVVTLHSFNVLLDVTDDSARKRMVNRFVQTLDISSELIAITESVREEAIRLGANPEKVTVIPNGVDPNRFSPQATHQARGKLELDQDKRYVLFVGNLQERKGVDGLIRAFARVYKNERQTQLLVVGSGEIESDLRSLVASLELSDSVAFVSRRSQAELPDWYNACDVFVSVPKAEPQGIVFLEAMACGKPCVGSNVGGIPMMLKEGKTGFLVEYGDVEHLANTIRMVLYDEELARGIGEQARQQVLAHFSWNQIAAQTKLIYQGVISSEEKKSV